jgi:hypothetical protein
MKKTYRKVEPIISKEDFLKRALSVKRFTSTGGKQYEVIKIENDEMHFRRLNANTSIEWSMNLSNVYKAYSELEDFKTINFKPYVPHTHSPARGLLL